MKNKWFNRVVALLLAFVLVFTSDFTAFAATAKTLKITTQPKSVTVSNGTSAKVSIKAQGDGLTYKRVVEKRRHHFM